MSNRKTASPLERNVNHLLGKAIHHYDLIHDGDRIAVAVSGGKDSLLLLWLLRERLGRLPVNYELRAIHVDLGFAPEPAEKLGEFFRREGFNHSILRTDYGVRAHSDENMENSCFLCARLRRSAIFRAAAELGYGKIAFGHNQDDFIETFFINICFGGQASAMLPNQSFFGGATTLIRPFALTPAAAIERLCARIGLPVVSNPCPSAHKGKRDEVRSLLDSLYANNPKVRGNIFHAMSNVNPDYLPPPLDARDRRRSRCATTETREHGRTKNNPSD